MTAQLGLVLQPAHYRVSIHYLDCHWFHRAQRRSLPLPPTVRFKPCKFCRPSDEDIRRAIPEWASTVEWYAWSPTPGAAIRIVAWFEGAENIAARRSMGLGKRLHRREGWA